MATKLQYRLYEVMERAEEGALASRIFDISILGLIILNVLAVVLDTVPDISDRYRTWFDGFELVSMVVFLGEYLLRL